MQTYADSGQHATQNSKTHRVTATQRFEAKVLKDTMEKKVDYTRRQDILSSYGLRERYDTDAVGVVAEGSHDCIWGSGSPREGVCALSVRESKGAIDG
jgi:hypothetical protein